MKTPILAKNHERELRREIAREVNKGRSNLFATFNSIDELIAAQNVRGLDIAVVMMAVNTTLRMVANQIDPIK